MALVHIYVDVCSGYFEDNNGCAAHTCDGCTFQPNEVTEVNAVFIYVLYYCVQYLFLTGLYLPQAGVLQPTLSTHSLCI